VEGNYKKGNYNKQLNKKNILYGKPLLPYFHKKLQVKFQNNSTNFLIYNALNIVY